MLAARGARKTNRDYFSVVQTCTANVVGDFKKNKQDFESLIAQSCRVRDVRLQVDAESVTLTVRKKPCVDLYNLKAKIHVFRQFHL